MAYKYICHMTKLCPHGVMALYTHMSAVHSKPCHLSCKAATYILSERVTNEIRIGKRVIDGRKKDIFLR
jgi:hypothetical protein